MSRNSDTYLVVRNTYLVVRNTYLAVRHTQLAIRNTYLAVRNAYLAVRRYNHRKIDQQYGTCACCMVTVANKSAHMNRIDAAMDRNYIAWCVGQ